MKLKDLIDVIDSNMEGLSWLEFFNLDGEVMFKAKSCSNILIQLYDREVEYLTAEDKNLFRVYLDGKI